MDIGKLKNLSYQDLEDINRRKKAERGKRDLLYLNQKILGHPDITKDPYGELINLLEKDHRHLLVIMPRGSIKSHLAESFIIQQILNNPNIRILYILETRQKAVTYLGGIKQHLESESFKNVYGDIKDNTCWREDAIRVKGRTTTDREPTVWVGSLESSSGLTGLHPDLIVGDDLHSLLNTRTLTQINQAKDVFTELVSMGEEKVVDGVRKRTRQVILGTYWVAGDIYRTITAQITSKSFKEILKERTVANDYWVLHLRSNIEECEYGETITIPGYDVFLSSRMVFPKISLDKLIDMWNQPTMDRYTFASQHLCRPDCDENTEFLKEDLEEASGPQWEKYKNEKLVRTMLMLDPAYSTNADADFSAFIYCGYTANGTLRVDLALNEKQEPHKLIDTFFSMRMGLKPHICAIESNGLQIMAKWIKDKRNELQQHFKIVEVKTPPRSKEIRIRALKSLFKSKKIAINPECVDLIKDLSLFPTTKKDDLPDCLSFILDEELLRYANNSGDVRVKPDFKGPFHQAPTYRPIGR